MSEELSGTEVLEVYEPPVLVEVGEFSEETQGPFGLFPEGFGSRVFFP
ncbi:lasso RiPP family leader peptide-containing protein [Streptomyces sp. NPDC052020]